MPAKQPALNEPSEWLKVMLLEVERKRRERLEAEREALRREQAGTGKKSINVAAKLVR